MMMMKYGDLWGSSQKIISKRELLLNISFRVSLFQYEFCQKYAHPRV